MNALGMFAQLSKISEYESPDSRKHILAAISYRPFEYFCHGSVVTLKMYECFRVFIATSERSFLSIAVVLNGGVASPGGVFEM